MAYPAGMKHEGRDETLDMHRGIPGFAVFGPEDPNADGPWTAVYRADSALVVSHDDWRELFMNCAAIRIRRTLQEAELDYLARWDPVHKRLRPVSETHDLPRRRPVRVPDTRKGATP